MKTFNTKLPDELKYLPVPYMNSILPTMIEESAQLPEIVIEAKSTGPFGAMPIMVISAGMFPPEREEEWKIGNELDIEMLNLSTDTRRIIAKDSGHYIQEDQPELIAEIVSDMVKKFITQQQAAGNTGI